MSIRKRLSPEESRGAALVAARELLIEMGPQAVTLKAVAGRIGRTHANLLHHFGSASGLQKALSEHLAGTVCATIAEAVLAVRAGQGSARRIVDMTFDAFDKEGAGALASWMILSGNEDALDPIVQAVHDLVEKIGEGSVDVMHLRRTTLRLILLALGDSQMGAVMARALDLPRGTARDIAEDMLSEAVAQELRQA